LSLPSFGNGLCIDDGTADIEFWSGDSTGQYAAGQGIVGVWGFRYSSFSKVIEKRGDGFAGQVASGGQNYDDAEPFKRKVYENFLGGFGQVSDNKVSGGVGIGGDDTKFFFCDAMTDRAGYLLPGMARNQIYNTYAASVLSVSGDANPRAGDEYSIPKGVLPCDVVDYRYLFNRFTTVSAINPVTTIRCLVNIRESVATFPITITCAVYLGAVFKTNFTFSITPSATANNYNGWTWVNLTNAGFNFLAATTYDLYFSTTMSNLQPNGPLWLGCYIGNPANTVVNTQVHDIRPYFQICKPSSTIPYTWWSGALRRVHQLLNGSAYVNVAVMQTAWLNPSATATGGSVANNPEVTFGGAWTGSIVVNNKLYIASTTGITGWSPAVCAANNPTPTNALDAGGLGISSLIAGYGFIYFVTNGGLGIGKWNGTFPFASTSVVAASTIGDPGSTISRIFFYQGNLWAVKPEGVFCLYGDPAILGSVPTNTPRILPMGDPFPTPHVAAGSYSTLHQGSIFINFKDRLYQYTVSAAGTQVQVIPLPMPWYRLGFYHQIDGIVSDGVNLYVSYNNLGVFKYINQTWHVVTESYESISQEPTNCGLSWVANPVQGCDNLYYRDGQALIQIPMPNPGSPYTRQFTLADQNKCGYLITSITNMEAAEMQKYVYSLVMSALPARFCFKVVPVSYITNQSPSAAEPSPTFNSLLLSTVAQGLLRDRWVTPAQVQNNIIGTGVGQPVSITQVYGPTGVSIANTIAPAVWKPSDFSNGQVSAEKFSYLTDNSGTAVFTSYNPLYNIWDTLHNPAVYTQTAFVIYFWDSVPNQASASGSDIMAVDSLVVKYQTIQDYIALYKISLSASEQTEGRSFNQSGTDSESSWEWLRTQFTAHRPVLVTVKVREQVDGGLSNNFIPNKTKRSFLGFLQNPSNQYGQPVVNKDTNQPLPERLDFEIVAAVGETYGI
jgi:hypothetical protein